MIEKLNPFYKLLKAGSPSNIRSEVKEAFDSVSKKLSNAVENAVRQLSPEGQLVVMIDASFKSAGYTLMLEENPKQKIQSNRKSHAPLAFGYKIFSSAQLKNSICSKDFFAIYMEFFKLAHILWEAAKPTIVLTDNKFVTRFSDESYPTTTVERK